MGDSAEVSELADDALDARVDAVARSLGHQYIRDFNRTRQTIGDLGVGVALGNAAHAVCSNFLLALAFGRRLVIRSVIIRGLFAPPAGMTADMIFAPGRKGNSERNEGSPTLTSSITEYRQLESFFVSNKASPHIRGIQWQFKVLAQGNRAGGSLLSAMLHRGGATQKDTVSDTFLAAVAFRFIFSSPSPMARLREAEYSAAVRSACTKSADGTHGWSDPWRPADASAAVQVEIVVHLRTWAEDSPCAKGAKTRFTGDRPFECGRCLPSAAIGCAVS